MARRRLAVTLTVVLRAVLTAAAAPSAAAAAAGTCPAACGVCPPPRADGACCHGGTTCEVPNWSNVTCTGLQGTWCPRIGPPPPPLPCPPPRSGDPPPATALQAKKPIYVVLRMDDIQVGYCGGRNTELSMIQWALRRNIKLNLGVVSRMFRYC